MRLRIAVIDCNTFPMAPPHQRNYVRSVILALSVSALLPLIGCERSPGPAGPQGVAGERGPPGVATLDRPGRRARPAIPI
jgi:hypothetical protein